MNPVSEKASQSSLSESYSVKNQCRWICASLGNSSLSSGSLIIIWEGWAFSLLGIRDHVLHGKDQQNHTSAVGPARSSGWTVRAELALALSLSYVLATVSVIRRPVVFPCCWGTRTSYSRLCTLSVCRFPPLCRQLARGPCDVWKFPRREGVLAPSGGSDL